MGGGSEQKQTLGTEDGGSLQSAESRLAAAGRGDQLYIPPETKCRKNCLRVYLRAGRGDESSCSQTESKVKHLHNVKTQFKIIIMLSCKSLSNPLGCLDSQFDRNHP